MGPTKISFKVSELTQPLPAMSQPKRTDFYPKRKVLPEEKLESAAVLFIEPHTH